MSTARTAIVVDDSRATRSVLARTLNALGFEVIEAHDGLNALSRLAESGPVDVALVDWNMPVMGGVDLIRVLRSDPAYERTVLIMVTTENDPAAIARALMAGADEYAMKPVTEESLASRLDLAGVDLEGRLR